jgi:FtsP/CotA-like multicopper oxidase with cupredoxin domain
MHRRRVLMTTLGLASPLARPGPAAAQARPPATTLRAVRRQIEVRGRVASVFGIIGPGGRAGWSGVAGEGFAVRLQNTLDEPTGIHWHGPTPPWRQDGVPGVSMDPIAPGAAADYAFPLDRPGTHWMHSHLGLQKQALMAAPLIVRPRAPADEQEVVVLLQDFSFTPADELLARLVGSPDPHAPSAAAANPHAAMGGMGLIDRLRSVVPGLGRRPAMPMDINDLDFDAYLANDRTLDDPEIVPVERSARVRLRLINGASATGFHVELGGLEGLLVAMDGEDLAEPVRVSRLPLAVSQRADVVIETRGQTGPWSILFQREGAVERTGIVLRPPGAQVLRVADRAPAAAPALDLALERTLRGPAPAAGQAAPRRITMDLTGDMAGYVWGLGDNRPIAVRAGERIEVVMRNRTMMAHPMHLHGHRFRVVGIGGQRLAGAERDSVLVPPMETVTIAFAADNPGRWPFHCHHLYHQVRGMETVLAYG